MNDTISHFRTRTAISAVFKKSPPAILKQSGYHFQDLKPFRRKYQMLALSFGLLVCLSFVTACGYRFSGSDGPPRGVEKLFIQLLENKSTEPGVGILLTNALKNEFIQKYQGVLAVQEQAEAVLSGSINGIRTETVTKRGALTSLERRVFMTIDLNLTSSDGERVWYARGITDSQTYSVLSGDKESSQESKRDALEVLASRIAERAFNRLSDDF